MQIKSLFVEFHFVLFRVSELRSRAASCTSLSYMILRTNSDYFSKQDQSIVLRNRYAIFSAMQNTITYVFRWTLVEELMILTRRTHSNYTSVTWLLVLAAQDHPTDRHVDKGFISNIPQRSPNVLLLRFLDRQSSKMRRTINHCFIPTQRQNWS